MLNFYEGNTNISLRKKDDTYLSEGNLARKIEELLDGLTKKNIPTRIWNKDYTLWSDKPDEIINRLGWLECSGFIKSRLNEINEFIQAIKAENIKSILLLGMGGSSLAPEMFSKIFGSAEGFPKLFVLDSTNPLTVKNYADKLLPSETLYIVSTKSGGTVETLSFMKYFFNLAVKNIGKENVGQHFAAITDPGSKLESTAIELGFRKVFLNDANIGGRYSALSLFGIVPAALIGVDINNLLLSADTAMQNSKLLGIENSSYVLGTIFGYYANEGQDKLTLVLSDSIKEFGAWAEQLVAESTGKNGTGIVPIDLEYLTETNYYACDRIFVFIRLSNDKSFDLKILEFKAHKFPIIEIVLDDLYDLGGEIFRWEMATVVASSILNIHPFNQPNVESAKIAAKQMMQEYTESGNLPSIDFKYEDENFSIAGDIEVSSSTAFIKDFLSKYIKNTEWCVGKNYVSLQAFLCSSKEMDEAFNNLRTAILQKYNVATTFGYGPRFLHSTGQLHKGDAGNGIFIQFYEDQEFDLTVPEEPGNEKSLYTFGTLIKAQMLGDRKALLENNRKVLTVKIKRDVLKYINLIAEKL